MLPATLTVPRWGIAFAIRLPHYPHLLLAVLTLVLLSSVKPARAAQNPRQVLLLYGSEKDLPMNVVVDGTLRSTFREKLSDSVDLYSEYIDFSRFTDKDYPRKMLAFLHDKYSARGLDLIVVVESSTVDAVQSNRDWFFPAVPVVFCCVTAAEYKARTMQPGVTGIPARLDYGPTLDAALRLHPGTRRVVVIAGASKSDADTVADARRDLSAFEGKVEIRYLVGHPMADLQEQVARLSGDAIIIYISISQDGAGKFFIPREALNQLAQTAKVPIYGYYDSYVGHGIVGGFVGSFEIEAKNAAHMGLRVLAGEKPEDISTAEATSCAYLFDWRQLKRWGVNEESLPPGSEVRYRDPSFWDLYTWHVIGGLSLCAVEAVLILGLLAQRAKGRRAEKERKRAEERFHIAVESAPVAMIMHDRQGRISVVNAQVEKLFGYRREELVGQIVEMVIPERFRRHYQEYREKFFAELRARPMGTGRNLVGLRRDGTEFSVEVGLSPVQTDAGLLVLAAIIDVTDRQRAEEDLRESEARFRLMADAAPILIWESGPDKGCTYFNKPWLEFTGRPLEQELGDGWVESIHTNDLPHCLEVYTSHFNARRPFEMEYRMRRHDGEYRWILDRGVPRLAPDGKFAGYMGACIDVNDRKRDEEQLRTSRERQRDLASQLLRAQEEERRRIAREMHDELTQRVAVMAIEVGKLEQLLDLPAPVTVSLHATHEQLVKLSEDVHDLSRQLHPAILDDLGLMDALRSECGRFQQREGIVIRCQMDNVAADLPRDAALCLYRITQEALRNVVRHAEASSVEVSLIEYNGDLLLTVADNGKGFELGGGRSHEGIGLASMEERARLIGAELSIQADPGQGTTITVLVPRHGRES